MFLSKMPLPESETERLLMEALGKIGPITIARPGRLSSEKLTRVLRVDGPNGVVLDFLCTEGWVLLFHWGYMREGKMKMYIPGQDEGPWPSELPIELRCEMLAKCLSGVLGHKDLQQRRPLLPTGKEDGGIVYLL